MSNSMDSDRMHIVYVESMALDVMIMMSMTLESMKSLRQSGRMIAYRVQIGYGCLAQTDRVCSVPGIIGRLALVRRGARNE